MTTCLMQSKQGQVGNEHASVGLVSWCLHHGPNVKNNWR